MPSVKSTMAMFETNPTAMRQKRASYSGPPGKTPTHEPKENPFLVQLRSVKREQPAQLIPEPSWEPPDLNPVFPDLNQPTRKQSVADMRRNSLTGSSSRKDSLIDSTTPPRKDSVPETKHPFRKDPPGRKESDTRSPFKKESVADRYPFRKESETIQPPKKEGTPERRHPFRKESETTQPPKKDASPETRHPFRKDTVQETRHPFKKQSAVEETNKPSMTEAEISPVKQPINKRSTVESEVKRESPVKQPSNKPARVEPDVKRESPVKQASNKPAKVEPDTKRESPVKQASSKPTRVETEIKRESPVKQPVKKDDIPQTKETEVKKPSVQNKVPPPPPPPPQGVPPPPPPMPGKIPPSGKRTQVIEKLRQRPRKRPDWCVLMKEIESGKSLKKVQTNDRSNPIIPTTKGKTGFIYQSESPNLRNKLLNEIQKGVKLKKTKEVRDRSRPNLEGLKKLRRQLTVEEQQLHGDEIISSEEELDDIDKIRDSLQATKLLLDTEVQQKKTLEQENEMLRRELEKLRKQEKENDSIPEIKKQEVQEKLPVCNGFGPDESLNPVLRQKSALNLDELDSLEEEFNSMKEKVAKYEKEKAKLEEKHMQAETQLSLTQAKLKDEEHKALLLSKKLKIVGEDHGIELPEVDNTGMQTDLASPAPAQNSEPRPVIKKEETPKENSDVTEEETEEEVEEEEEEVTESEEEIPIMKDRSIEKEVAMLETRLRNTLEKEKSATLEKQSLKKQITKVRKELMVEGRRYKKLKKEVDDVGKLLEGSDDESEEEKAEKENEESDSGEEEIEEEETETEDESDESEYEARGPFEERKKTLNRKIKEAEERLQIKKKANYRLKAQLDRLLETLKRDRQSFKKLEEELNTVLAELG